MTVAKDFGIAISSVSKFGKEFGIKKDPNYRNFWSATDLDFLKKNYCKLTKKEIAEALGVTISRVHCKIARLKLPKYSETFQRKVAEEYKRKSALTVAEEFGVTPSTVRRMAKRFGIKRNKNIGRRRHQKLEGLNLTEVRKKGSNSEHRLCLLHVYNYTCYDCGLYDPSGEDLHHHVNYDTVPVQSLILCKKCHGKRHRWKSQ